MGESSQVRPSLWNMSSNVLNATGLTRLANRVSDRQREFVLDAWKTHYPSMPASNAFRLSSSEDMPVSARITLD